jgi:serine phosphatase RsbU (regulator of sigma subunit)
LITRAFGAASGSCTIIGEVIVSTSSGSNRGFYRTAIIPVAVLTLIVLLITASTAAGDATSQDVVIVTPEAVRSGIVLREGWRFRAGDDPGWAAPDLDDSDWQRISSVEIELGPEGIGWLRRRLFVDSSLSEPVIGLYVRQTVASEIFFDGRRVATLGVISADPEHEVAWDPLFPVGIAVDPGSEHLLAVRFSIAHVHAHESGFRGIELRLGELEAMMEKATHALRMLIPLMAAAAGLAGALALVHCLLFLFDRRVREHAYFTVFAGFMSLDVFADMMMKLTADFATKLLWLRLGVVLLVGMLLAGIQLELVLFERRRGWVFHGLALAGVAIVAWSWSIQGLRSILPLVVFMMLAIAEMLRLAVLELIRRRPDSGVVAAGLAVLALSFLDFFGDYFGLYSLPSGIFIIVGWGAIAVSLSLYIARRASRTNRELRHRLIEVDELTRHTVEQERRAAREQAERLVLEADNTRKTRELEEARALQLAMLPHDQPLLADVDVAFRMLTATEVGGDYYDHVTDSSRRCTIAVGDATGHGMHAGMVVAVAKSLFTTLAPNTEPMHVLQEISGRLAGLHRRGATMAMVIIGIDRTRLQVAGAAMPPLLVWRSASCTVEEVSLSATPLGSPLANEIPAATLDLAPGDTVLVTTDGLAEVLDPAGKPWGYESVAEAYAQVAHLEAEGIISELLQEAESFASGRELADDVTLIAIQAREKGEQ